MLSFIKSKIACILAKKWAFGNSGVNDLGYLKSQKISPHF
ncbi:hypothetical protein HMPREF9096_00647 [Haemophilus sp. oral taxon 851 str. F0397]|uniref:Uncharacterized protein n=1 Tax=Haemophilus haemolyticus TaxID=726 RepID=A0AAQ1YLH4_HAEHA|nr:hypothetical protein HMPREF9096_00647 [Haemophilus sp. oral taxon 851 str. F0397]TDN42207.1 hypothetical protein EGH31_0871 [Haemophilus haemolyticus]